MSLWHHLANQYDGPIGSDPPPWDFPTVGDKVDQIHPVAPKFPRIIGGYVDEQGISEEEMSDVDPQEAYTAVKLVVLIPRQAAKEIKENPKVAEQKNRLVEAYLQVLSGVANNNPPNGGKFGTAKIKLKPS